MIETPKSIAAMRAEAKLGSDALLNHLMRTGNIESDPPLRRLTHDEQVERILAGKAHIVTMPRMPDPDRTLGGVTPW